MKKAYALLALVCLTAACASSEKEEEIRFDVARSSLARDGAPTLEAAEKDTLAAGQAAFAVDIYKTVASDASHAGKNVFLSPYSISTALAMTYAGARASTRDEMKKTLHFDLPDDRLHPAMNWLDLELGKRGQGRAGKDGSPMRLHVINTTWAQKNFGFEAPFLDTLAVSYGAGVNLLDFESDATGARKIINDWVQKETEERIEELLPENSLDSLTRMVLVNAVYFNAAWASKFKKAATSDAPFTKLDGSTTSVPTLRGTESRRYAKTEAYEATEVDYDGGELSLLLVAPAAGTFAAFEGSLTGDSLLGVLGAVESSTSKPVDLSFPKGRIETTAALKGALQTLGMKAPFEAADFSGISTQAELLIKDVHHKTFLAIDEEGTEAAAATAVVVGERSSIGAPVESIRMIVDRPYVLAIVDRATRSLLFVGRVLDPSSK